MPIPRTNAKVFVPTLIILSLFLAACSSSTNEAATASPSTAPIAMEQTSPTASDTASSSPDEITAEPIATKEADGTTYTQTVNYNNPGGGDDVGFTIKVDNDGTITAASADVKADPGHAISVTMQTNFAAALSGEVVGKKVADLEVDRIGGASLTTGAFEKFLTAVQAQS